MKDKETIIIRPLYDRKKSITRNGHTKSFFFRFSRYRPYFVR